MTPTQFLETCDKYEALGHYRVLFKLAKQFVSFVPNQDDVVYLYSPEDYPVPPPKGLYVEIEEYQPDYCVLMFYIKHVRQVMQLIEANLPKEATPNA